MMYKPPVSMPDAARPRFEGAPRLASPTALLLLDWINPFSYDDADRLRGPALAAAHASASLKAELHKRGVQAIYANDNYGVWRSDFQGVIARCRALGGVSAEIVRLLTPGADDIAVIKARHSAFYETSLQLLLQDLGARQLILVGLATEWCVLFTAIDAYVRGYSLWVPEDCVASSSPERQQATLHYMTDVLGAHVACSAAIESIPLGAAPQPAIRSGP